MTGVTTHALYPTGSAPCGKGTGVTSQVNTHELRSVLSTLERTYKKTSSTTNDFGYYNE